VFPYDSPSHLGEDISFLGVLPRSFHWLMAGFGLGFYAAWKLAPLLLLTPPGRFLEDHHASLVLRIVAFVLVMAPCYLLARWRPLDSDPAFALLVWLEDVATPSRFDWQPWAEPPPPWPDATGRAPAVEWHPLEDV
jgi:hypothetical protein